jgi:glycosyltransferase involved in cell wall biosynthesis
LINKKIFNISIFIITYNEEKDIEACLNSVRWSNDVVILDSFSDDNTLIIAKNFDNVRIFQRKFDNYASQRNYGLKNIDYLNEWVLIIDADETCTDKLRDELLSGKIHNNYDRTIVSYSLRRKTYFSNKWLKHNAMYNVWIDRLVKHKEVVFFGKIHEKIIYEGSSEKLLNDLNHYPFSKGIDHWISRRNKYSSLSAEHELLKGYNFKFKDLFSKNPVKFRSSLNSIYRKLPLRWLIFFLYNFFIKMGFLDGLKGAHFILLETYYEFLIVCKINYKKDAK